MWVKPLQKIWLQIKNLVSRQQNSYNTFPLLYQAGNEKLSFSPSLSKKLFCAASNFFLILSVVGGGKGSGSGGDRTGLYYTYILTATLFSFTLHFFSGQHKSIDCSGSPAIKA